MSNFELDDDYWHLCDELTVSQAAHLVIGVSPNLLETAGQEGLDMAPSDVVRYKSRLNASLTAIKRAILRGRIEGRVVAESDIDFDGKLVAAVEGTVDADASVVDVESLRGWLRTRGFKTGFFFSQDTDEPDYLDPLHPRYATKLAASVKAWLAVDDPKGKHPKQALIKWLREHSAEFDLSDDDGKPNEQGIEECAKVANWQPGGGAPKTPST